MSLSSMLAELSPEQQSILEHKQIEGNYKPKQLVKLLRKLAAYDRENDAKRASLSSLKSFFGFMCVMSIIAAIISFAFVESVVGGVVALSILLISIIAAVVLLRRIEKLEATDLANEMRRVLLPFALVMQEEVKPGSKLSVKLDANAANADRNLKIKDTHTGTYGRTISTYEQEWLSASATLMDGTSLQVNCTKTVFDIDIVKRSASGKTKYKSKLKSRDDVLVKMFASDKLYTLSERDAGSNVSVMQMEQGIAIRGKYKFKTMNMKTLQVQTLLDLIHQMYGVLTPKNA